MEGWVGDWQARDLPRLPLFTPRLVFEIFIVRVSKLAGCAPKFRTIRPT